MPPPPDTDIAGLVVRDATSEDRSAILALCASSLGWSEGDPNAAFFAWKHDENAFGPSPAWVAVDPDGRILGVRCFLRWRFRDPTGRPVEAVRAVDTATHPDARGRGVFRRLTLGALPELEQQAVAFVFNTPNDQSRPGYLAMGWQAVGRVPLGVRPSGVRARLRPSETAWTGAAKWSVATDVGTSPREAFADDEAVAALLRSLPAQRGLTTDRSAAFLRWRYGFEPLSYRVLPVGRDLAEGAIVFRLRRRGRRLDATICEELLPRRRAVERAYGSLARATGADLLVRAQPTALGRGPFVRVARLGPILTWMPLDRRTVPSLGDLSLTSGDLELF